MKTLVGPLTYVIIFLLCFSGYYFVFFVVFTHIEVLVKEKEEKQVVTFVHIINFFFQKRDVFPPFTQSFLVMPDCRLREQC